MLEQELPTKSHTEYKKLAHLGRGVYGDVFLCEHDETKDHFCMKEMDLTFHSVNDRTRCLTEVTLLQQLPAYHNIVKFREAYWAQSTNQDEQILVLILEYADGGDLEQHLRLTNSALFNEDEARRIFRQVAQGVSHLHRHRVLHRDLKCSNIFLFRSGRVVLGDFGTSKQFESDQALEPQDLTATVVGSPLYMSPEVLEGERHGFATDIWSLGCVLYEMLTRGTHAFDAPSYPAVVYRITQGEYDPLNTALVSDEGRDLVAKMLQKEPQSRPNIAEVLQSPWLAPSDSTKVLETLPTSDCPASKNQLPVASTQEPSGSLIDSTNALRDSAKVDKDRTCELELGGSQQSHLPPPAPIKRTTKSPVRQLDRLGHNYNDDNSLQRQLPLIRLDLAPQSHNQLPSAASIPFNQQQPKLEIRGVRMLGPSHQHPSRPKQKLK